MKTVIGVNALICAAAVGMIVWQPEGVRWPGIVLLALAVFSLGAVLFLWCMRHKRLQALHESIEAFLREGVEPPFSLGEDAYAQIENDIAEIAHRMLSQREALWQENRKTLDFISDVSHQLKTPLASLKLYCEMQYTDRRQLTLIQHMETLIYSLLRLQKLEAGAYEMRFAPHDMGDLVADIVHKLSILYPHKAFTADIGSVAFRFDEYWMGEAILNVLKNACEHTADDGEVSVFVERDEKSVILIVQDDGGGVLAEELPRLFQRFYRAGSQSGTGLGLAITRTVVEKHHGVISARNGEKGLRVMICLPILSGRLPIS